MNYDLIGTGDSVAQMVVENDKPLYVFSDRADHKEREKAMSHFLMDLMNVRILQEILEERSEDNKEQKRNESQPASMKEETVVTWLHMQLATIACSCGSKIPLRFCSSFLSKHSGNVYTSTILYRCAECNKDYRLIKAFSRSIFARYKKHRD